MARVKANVSFAGEITMGYGEIKDIPEGDVLKDLLDAGYVEEADGAPEAKEKPSDGAPEEPEAPQKKKRGTKK